MPLLLGNRNLKGARTESIVNDFDLFLNKQGLIISVIIVIYQRVSLIRSGSNFAVKIS